MNVASIPETNPRRRARNSGVQVGKRGGPMESGNIRRTAQPVTKS